ncbi:tryptophan 2,3-dioxygenase [Billgrantia bachuensis]|uniref:Tryptophan 2,3-dioxygenase n=1 Tax=Billgrantia bachuensis TaxID=2717286 RepID=A0ABX0PQY2_9GAMM|nr:tryptophan 2,3-dioxygenase [Halomonas bachuensis]NIC05610.1 tryptophan 2,3-dioxygenase [Halomonas bachuensis]
MARHEGEPARGATVDLTQEAVHWDQPMSYGEYLQLGPLLSAQQPGTEEHDEMLFIVIHQVSELWLKQCLHEAHAAAAHIAADRLRPAFKMLSRVARIQAQMINAWEVLVTMTPADYARFRDSLGQSSGFQSFQYRELEFLLGNKNPAMVEVHRRHPTHYQRLSEVLRAPSLYDVSLQLLARRGFELPESVVERDWSEPYRPCAEVEQAWAAIYRDVEHHWELYELAEKLVDTEYHFHQWRFSHLKTVERIIGQKPGNGGTGGVSFLAKALDLQFFPELWSVRTTLEEGTS